MLRAFWIEEIRRAFEKRPIVWLSGVRRSGKTTLVRDLEGASYHDCELVRVRRALEDPELFFRDADSKTIVLDEIHRLPNPSEVLKVAADHFAKLRIVATGSSTLAAREKFRDTLTGRKQDVWLVPMIAADLAAFESADLDRRMLRGGLPPFFLADGLDDAAYEEWIASYWAKDLSELFVVDKKTEFTRLVELIFMQSGGMFESQKLATACGVSRPTVQQWLSILETTLLATTLRPFHGGAASEIRSQPKVYAFDTGFVAYFRGWDTLRNEDRGTLLEHLVLGEIAARFGTGRLHYWRDKAGHEVDFVLEVGRRREVVAIECKSSAANLDPAGLAAMRSKHPRGRNVCVTLRSTEAFTKRFGELEVEHVPYLELPAWLDALR